QVAIRPDGNAGGVVQRFFYGESLATVGLRTVACDGGDAPVGAHLADAVVEPVGDINVPRAIDCDVEWKAHRRALAIAAIAAETISAIAGDGFDQARVAIDASHAIVLAIRDVNVRRTAGSNHHEAARVDGGVDRRVSIAVTSADIRVDGSGQPGRDIKRRDINDCEAPRDTAGDREDVGERRDRPGLSCKTALHPTD